MKPLRIIIVAIIMSCATSAHAGKLTIAAAADLKFAMEEIVSGFKKQHKGDEIEVVYGSSGKFQTQIRQGAPYDMFFSADIAYPRELARIGMASSKAVPYAFGRIVVWSSSMDASKMSLGSLVDPKIGRIAIANPKHAPYGKRAEEALRSSGLWDRLQPKLIFGENIAHTAQFVQTGNAQAGIIALSLALNPELSKKGAYFLIPEKLHQPLEQGYVITRRAEGNALAKSFADHMKSLEVRRIMVKYGFVLPGEVAEK